MSMKRDTEESMIDPGNTTSFKPMLAGKAPTDLIKLDYPLLVSPKIDGIRCLIIDGVALSRNLLPIPNPTVQELFGDPLFNGFDGELLIGDVGDPLCFNNSQSVMSHAHFVGEMREALRFHVFDDFGQTGPFELRFKALNQRIRKSAKYIKIVPHHLVNNHHGITGYEELFLADGYEGLMIRDPAGRYKHGRSTTREGGLLKLKRHEDAEARVVGFKELLHNDNEDRTGGVAQRRSTKQSGKRGGQLLGALQVVGVNGQFKGVRFDVGTGFNHAQRESFWRTQNGLLDKFITYRFVPHGSKDAPRFPVFKGFRHEADL